MKGPHRLLISLYSYVLLLYPRRLRLEYREQIMLSLRDSYHDCPTSKGRFWFNSVFDLLQSSLSERLYMLRDHVFRQPIAYYTLALALVLTLAGGVTAVTMQQMLRRGADQPQVDMADRYAGEIGSGEAPGNVIPPGYVDLERSLQPFVIFYDDFGKAGTGTGYIDQSLPVLPSGVLEFVRSHGSENVTWQPRPGIRIASVIKHVTGKRSGFILAGRSLRTVEEQESLLRRMFIGGWIVLMLLLLGGASLLTQIQGRPQAAI
jgi:hypothetical protein